MPCVLEVKIITHISNNKRKQSDNDMRCSWIRRKDCLQGYGKDRTSRRKIRLKEGSPKCRHIKMLTCKGTFWQVFIRVYRLEIASFLCTFSSVYTTRLWDLYSPLLPLSPSLWFSSPPPSLCEYVYFYTRIQSIRGGGGNWVLGLRRINTCRKVHL